jgi:hypothetical protein
VADVWASAALDKMRTAGAERQILDIFRAAASSVVSAGVAGIGVRGPPGDARTSVGIFLTGTNVVIKSG